VVWTAGTLLVDWIADWKDPPFSAVEWDQAALFSQCTALECLSAMAVYSSCIYYMGVWKLFQWLVARGTVASPPMHTHNQRSFGVRDRSEQITHRNAKPRVNSSIKPG